MADMLGVSSHLPEIKFGPGETIVREGGAAGVIWILVSGSLQVRKGSVLVNTITRPGALVGEVSLLLGTTHTATVETTGRSVLRFAADGDALLSGDPAITKLVAVGLTFRTSKSSIEWNIRPLRWSASGAHCVG